MTKRNDECDRRRRAPENGQCRNRQQQQGQSTGQREPSGSSGQFDEWSAHHEAKRRGDHGASGPERDDLLLFIRLEPRLEEAVRDRSERRPHQAAQSKHDHRKAQITDERKCDRAHRPETDDRDQ